MYYELIGVKNKGSSDKLYVYRDIAGNIYNFTSKDIKDSWEGNTFQNVKIDKLGRLIEDSKSGIQQSTPSLVQRVFPTNSAQGYAVITGTDLEIIASRAAEGKQKRFAVNEIIYNLENYRAGKVCTVKGLRRTGKTTAILQAISELLHKGVSAKKIGYITVTVSVTALDTAVTDEVISVMEQRDWDYVFVDEITHLTDILNKLKLVSDVIAYKKKIVLTGTDSYVWPMAAKDVLYGRTMLIDLTYMSFREYCHVFPQRIQGLSHCEIVEQFCRFGGVLDESEYTGMQNAYISLQSAIVGNIVNTIRRNKEHPTIKEYTGELYTATKEQVTEAVICAILNACGTQSSEIFKTQGIKIPKLAASIMERASNYKSVGVRSGITKCLMAALIELNILDRVDNFAKASNSVVPQGNMELVCHVSSLYNTIIGSIDKQSTLTGGAFENLILSQCVQYAKTVNREYVAAHKMQEVTVGYCRYDVTPEYLVKHAKENKTAEADIVVRCMDSKQVSTTCFIETKISSTPKTEHAKNMFIDSMIAALGKIDRYIVVYMGDTLRIREVEYVNAYDFLMDIGKWVT